MFELWCPQCREWREYEQRFFYSTPRCEECGTELQDPDASAAHEVDYKEMERVGDTIRVGGVDWFDLEDEEDEEDSGDETDDAEGEE